MILTLLLLLALLLVLSILLLARRGDSRPPARFEDVDVQAFRRLMDTEDILFLREKVPPAAFRSLQRQRAKVALRYLDHISASAAWVSTAFVSPALEHQANAAELEREALQVRILALRAKFAVALWFVFPGAQVTLPLANRYAALRGHYEQINRAFRALESNG